MILPSPSVSNCAQASPLVAPGAAFGEVALPPITSIKSVMGHPQAGAGAFSLLSAVLALENSRMPPTAGLEEVDPALDGAEIVHAAGTALTKRNLMVNAFGFGGNNCVMIVSDPAALGLSMEAA